MPSITATCPTLGGRLILVGELDGALPLEDAAHAASNPVVDDFSVVFDQAKIEARKDAQVQLLLAGDPAFVPIPRRCPRFER